jgi:hypothetical protein
VEKLDVYKMTKGCIFYTDFNAEPKILDICREQLKKSFDGEIVSVSLNKPCDLGRNIVLEGTRSNTMYTTQILTALEASTSDIVFFTEHDVLYDKAHFDFIPNHDDLFYYNTNLWRWEYPKDRIITYDNLTSLSQMCCYREWAVEHYKKRLKRIKDTGWDKQDGIGNLQPVWIRALGYEPGTKRRRIGGFSDDLSERWVSKEPNVDIRHGQTLSNPKTHLSQFKHLPVNFREEKLDIIKNFNLKELFDVK